MSNSLRRTILSVGAVIALGLAIFAWRHFFSRAGEFSYTATESGFEEFGEGEEELLASSSPRVSPADGTPVLQPAGGGQFSRWGAYWREFSKEEKLEYGNWQRPAGPLRVGLQAGHWKNSAVPEELSGLKRNGGGASGGGKSEWEVALAIAERTKTLLEAEDIVVDLLPATVPPDYVADAFVSIHADGNNNSLVSGFKVAGPRRDFSGRASALVSALYESYQRETGLDKDANVTRRMSGYYAFNWRR